MLHARAPFPPRYVMAPCPIAACPQDPRQIAAGHIHILLIIRPKLQGSTVSLRNLASCPPLLYLGPRRCIPFPSSRPLDPSSSSTARSLVSDHFVPCTVSILLSQTGPSALYLRKGSQFGDGIQSRITQRLIESYTRRVI